MGFSWSVFGHIVQLLAPTVISVVNPKLAPIAGAISGGIGEAEQIPGASGADKLQHVLNIANEAASAVNAQAGKTVINTSDLNEAVTEAVDTTVAVIKTVHPVVAANVVAPSK